MNNNFDKSFFYAKALDEEDVLKDFKYRFVIDENITYLDGNSLGRLPVRTKEQVYDWVEKQWGSQLIESWNKNWYNKSAEIGDKIAQIIGAHQAEVIVSDSTSVNLYKLAHAALKLKTERNEIVSDVHNFPTDLYILQGLVNDFGEDYKLVLANAKDEISIDLEDLQSKITKNTALVVLSLVSFKSSFLYDAEEITKWAHKKGALVLWDLSHAAGAIPVDLDKSGADLAVGCTYKYLNGGPGAPAFLYVRRKLQKKLFSPIQGWFGDEKPFEFDLDFRPAEGIRKFLAGTPPVISQLAIEPGIDLILEAGMWKIHRKSMQLTEYFISLVNAMLPDEGFEIGSPLNPKERGSHISLKHPEAYRICQALIEPKKLNRKVIPDFREPDNIRFGFTPLYLSFVDIWMAVLRLREIMEEKEYSKYSKNRKGVT